MKIYVGSDHAAFDLKQELVQELKNLDHQVEDQGTHSADSVHYPNFAITVCKNVLKDPASRGILLCGSGIGMSIVANKFKGIRAALCRTEEDAKLSRQHNDANVLCLGGRVTSIAEMKKILSAWLNTDFAGGRHAERLELFKNLGI